MECPYGHVQEDKSQWSPPPPLYLIQKKKIWLPYPTNMGWASCKPPLFKFEEELAFAIRSLVAEFDVEDIQWLFHFYLTNF